MSEEPFQKLKIESQRSSKIEKWRNGSGVYGL
jgi:hypothetical protein